MSIIDEVKSALKQRGPGYVVRNGPTYAMAQAKQAVIPPLLLRPGTLDRDELIARCQSEDALWWYGSTGRFEIEPPLTATPTERMRRLLGAHEVEPSFVGELRDMTLSGDRAFTRLPDGRYLLEEMGTNAMLGDRLFEAFERLSARQKVRTLIGSQRPEKSQEHYETVVNLVPRHGGRHNNQINYGHWLLEDLPRLRGVRHYEERTGRDTRVLVMRDPPTWMSESLELLGYTPDEWVEWTGEHATVSRLVVPKLNYVHSTGWEYQPANRKWVADEMKSRTELSDGAEQRRIYLSRQNQSRRKVRNFSAVSDTLDEFDIEPVRPEELTVSEQVRLFDSAELIVGPPGSGFANAVFATDATLLQLIPHGAEVPIWYILTSEQGLEYDHLIGEPLSDATPGRQKNADILVDVSKLARTLESILGRAD